MDNNYEKFKFNLDEIIKLSKSIIPINILKNFESYNDEMTISQVVKFFERHGIIFTKTMIQNYIRVGILPPPVDKRYYIKNHLILLAIIDSLKSVYSLEEIGNIFKYIMKDNKTFDDDIIDIATIYNEYIILYEKSINDLNKNLPSLLNKITDTSNKLNIKNEDKDIVSFFLTSLTLMTQSIVTKELIKLISNNIENKNNK